MNKLYNKYENEIQGILARYPVEEKRSAVMPLLFLAQRETNYVPAEALADIAEITGISETDVASILGFYTLFHAEPAGRYRIQICTDLPCALRGSESFLAQLCERLSVKEGETTEDGLFSVEAVKCLAACHRAPMFQLQGDGEIKYYEDQTVEITMQIVEEIRRKVAAEKEA
ncbi:MAG TPA: NAD(P)H-dependent oxidoreductase subunit E [Anaerolineaceae bacterium]|nr:NAD(P)H-dependent oxidoreductase subunit E [Anaerolineaceae bacterium]